MTRRAPLVTYITDSTRVSEEELLAKIQRLDALPPAVRARCAVQLRDPTLPAAELLRLGDLLRTATEALGLRFFVNDRLDLARALAADGVHLGSRSVRVEDARGFLGRDAFVSVACHSIAEVVRAAEAGASACTLSPIFASPGKAEPLGIAVLAAARDRLAETKLNIPIIALGGMGEDTFDACLSAGAAGVAMIRGEVPASAIVRR